MSPRILFFAENIEFTLKNKTQVRLWVEETVLKEGKRIKAINFIFCNDEYLNEINCKYLKHKKLTDVVTFNFSEEPKKIAGEIYISIERVVENALKFETEFINELHRVMIHGILHLIGYTDKTGKEKKLMRTKEDFYLGRRDRRDQVTW
ncbi:MAG: rRNA maturation RNase YbeY [Bacteroidetes bacterium]|nr:rRNA maturation RNase YbeY [Bacteroidota bacterium]